MPLRPLRSCCAAEPAPLRKTIYSIHAEGMTDKRLPSYILGGIDFVGPILFHGPHQRPSHLAPGVGSRQFATLAVGLISCSAFRLSSFALLQQKTPPIRQGFRCSCTEGGTRTHTECYPNRILSPACLPISPPRQEGRQK